MVKNMSKRTVKKTSTGVKVLIVLMAIALLGVAWYAVDPTLAGFLTVKPSEDHPTGLWEGGTFALSVDGRNSLDASASATAGTDFTASFYGFRSGSYQFLGSDTGSGVDVESIPADNGYVWLMVKEISTKYYYADAPNTVAQNTYMKEYRWVDIDGDTNKEWIYKCDLWNIPTAGILYPSRTYYPYFLDRKSVV